MKLSVIYDKRQKDFVVKYPRVHDGHLALNHLVGDILRYKIPDEETRYPYNWVKENFIVELEKRGYDIKTLKFSIEQKKDVKHICPEASHIECTCKDKCLRNINNY